MTVLWHNLLVSVAWQGV